MLISFQDMHFWAIFLPQFQSFQMEILKSTSQASNDLGFQKYFNTGVFLPISKFGPTYSKIKESSTLTTSLTTQR